MAKLTIEIGAKIDAMQRGLANARAGLNNFAKSVSGAFTTGAKAGIAAMATGVGLMLQKSVKLAAAMEQTQVSFKVMTGSADKARAMVEALTQFANSTPFESAEIMKSAKVLMGFGVAAKDVLPTLRLLGDVSAGTGKDLTELAVIFGQIRANGKLMGGDLLQLINAGFNPLLIISKQTGRSMADLRKDMEAGLITFDMVEGAFKSATSEGGLFFNMMQEQSQTLNGKLSTLNDAISKIGVGIGESLLPELKKATDQALRLADSLDQIAQARKLTESGQVQATNPMATAAGQAAINAAQVASIAVPGGIFLAPLWNRLRKELEDGAIETAAATVAEIQAGTKKIREAQVEAAKTVAPKEVEQAWADSDQAWGARVRMQEKLADEEMGMLKEMANADKEQEAAAAEFGVQGMQDALESRRAALEENAAMLQGEIGDMFTPAKMIQSNLARVGGERTIQLDRQVPLKQLETLKATLDQLKQIEQTIKETSGARWPG
jgi:tape measure domain-containing protein